MDKIYYQPNHFWKGQKAVKKLKELSGEKPKVIKQWLSRQAFWQVHLPAPKRVDRPHYEVTTPNEMHQFDLLYMPSDSLYGNISFFQPQRTVALIIQDFLGIPILLKPFGGLEQNLRCIQSFIFISLSYLYSKV